MRLTLKSDLNRYKGRGLIHASSFEHPLSYGLKRTCYHRDPLLDNSRLFAGNRGQSRSEELLVIETNIGNHTDLGCDDVCRIEAASEACFRNDNIGLLLCEIKESHRCYHLEKSGRLLSSRVARIFSNTWSILSAETSSSLMRKRSVKRTRCGEVYRPTLIPWR